MFSAQILALCPRWGQVLKAPKAHFLSDSKHPSPVTTVNPTGWLPGVTSSTPLQSSPDGSQANVLTREGGNCLTSIKPGGTGRWSGAGAQSSATLRAPLTEGGTGVRGQCPHVLPRSSQQATWPSRPHTRHVQGGQPHRHASVHARDPRFLFPFSTPSPAWLPCWQFQKEPETPLL